MKGIVLTLDAIIAFIIMTVTISLLIFFRIETTSPFLITQQLHSLSEDVLTIFSESKLREVTSPTLLNQYTTPPNPILNESDLDKKTIDVIGALWAANKTGEAGNITKDILNNLIPNNMGYQILINEDNVYNSSDTARPAHNDATVEISSSRIVSGYEKYKPVTGYVARAWAAKISRNITEIIPINLAWGEFDEDESNYWGNGYAPPGERSGTSILIKNFTIPSDATIFSQYLQFSPDTQNAQILINGRNIWSSTSAGNTIREFNLVRNITPGQNELKLIFNRSNGDLAHFHPGTFIKIKYNTSEVESGSNKTVFYTDWIQGSPAAAEIIPFFVNAPIRNVTAYVDIKNMNAFLLLTLNYRYNKSNPLQNVLLYREYPTAINCNQFSSQSSCQAHSEQCSWNPTTLTNRTIFHATFDSWSTSTNCGGATAEGWTECIMNEFDGTLYWRARSGTASYNSSSTRYHEGNDMDTSNATWITKCLNLSSYSKSYVTFWYSKTSTSSQNERQYILVNRTGAGNFINIWNSTTSASPWTYQELNITNYISSYTCIRYMAGAASSTSEALRLDDFKIMGNSTGSCENKGLEDVKNRTYEIILNETGALINEYNSTGSLLNTLFNTNVTINDIQNNMTNTLGIYADIRAPINYTIPGGDGDVDWQRLGMYAHDNTAGHGNDHNCFITDKTNITVYHDLEQYGLEYGRVDITTVENFTDTRVCCVSKKGPNCYASGWDNRTCKDAFINLTFPFSTRIILSRVIGTESLGGNDNGYNWVWMWNETSPTNETNIVLDTDTPPGTFTYLPVRYFELNKINTIRVGDKDNGRYLNTDPTTFIGNKRSIIEYTFLIPSQVGYGSVFNTSNDAANNAIERLEDVIGRYAVSADVHTENYTVSNVPHMWGPVNIKVRVWI
jgi:hypothetical protein